jgi:hypothetical protein
MRVPNLNWPADLYKDADLPKIVATDETVMPSVISATIDVRQIEIARLTPSASRSPAPVATTDYFTRAAA